MRLLSWEDFLLEPPLASPLAATIGVFDGLHIGHRRLIASVLDRDLGETKAVFTFRDNPKRILRPSGFHGNLATLRQKLEAFEALEFDVCVLIDFSGNFSKLAGRDFLSLLREKGNLEYVAVGSNFSCGYKLDTKARDVADFYERIGVRADVLEPVLWEGHAVSSSRIRTAIIEGRLEDATAMLGRNYEIDLRELNSRGPNIEALVFERPSAIVLPPEGEFEAMVIEKGRREKVNARISRDGIEFSRSQLERPDSIALVKLLKDLKR